LERRVAAYVDRRDEQALGEGTLQEALMVALRRVLFFVAWKKEVEVWRSSDMGWQAWKAVSLRKAVMNVGQEFCVKLLPRLESKALGRAAVDLVVLLLSSFNVAVVVVALSTIL